jgi:glycosyltransferase involved in cell wall biosynthesis
VALIVKNEERVLGRCLESLRGAVDEIVIVDTGSEDGTKRIAERYTYKIYDFAWRDNFAAARQFAFDHVTSDWVAWFDADDVVLQADRIKPLLAATPPQVCGYYWRYICGWDPTGKPNFEFWRERCVRNDGTFRWVGRVHEVLVPQRPCVQLQNHDVVVEHHPEATSGEPGRNLRILEDEYAANGGHLEPRMLFYLGREFADAGKTERAIEVLQQYLQIGEWDEERYRAQVQVAQLYRAQAQYRLALDANLQALKILPEWPDAYFGLAQTYYFLQDWPKVKHWCNIGLRMHIPQGILFTNPRDYDFNWIIYYTNALYHTGELEEALTWTRRALRVFPDDPWHRHNVVSFERELGFRQQGISPPDIGTPNEIPEITLPVAHIATYAVIPVRDRHDYTRRLLAQLGLPPERVIVLDNGSTVPASEALVGLARIVELPSRNISELWNAGLDLIASECSGAHNVAVLNNDLEVDPRFLDRLAAGLRAQPDHVIAYPDEGRRLPDGSFDHQGRMTGYAFMLRGEDGIRADPQFVWWCGDDDIERQGRARGKVVCVGGVEIRHLEPNASTSTDPELQAKAMQDQERFLAKWERPELEHVASSP